MAQSAAVVLGCCVLMMSCSTPESDRSGPPLDSFGVGDGCDSSCTIDGQTWRAPDYTAADIERLEAAELTTPFATLAVDPYASEAPPQAGDGVCVLRFVNEARTAYALETFASSAEAVGDDVRVTHGGACGLCSPLQDLAVYLRNPDLTTPVRACAMMGVFGAEEDVLSCLGELGFTPPCAQIWALNANNTRQKCFDVCVALLDAPFNEPDGSINACLACDEEMSGPTFKAVAGRTRRNSGIPAAICRPCDGLQPVDHRYW